MPSRIHKTALATVDIETLAHYLLAEAGSDVALRFVDSAERAFDQLVAMPEIGVRLGCQQASHSDIRRWHVDSFPRLVILYRIIPSGIEIVRVLHGARDIDAIFRDS